VSWFVIRVPESHKETEFRNQIAPNGEEMKNSQQMLSDWSVTQRKKRPPVPLETMAVCTEKRERERERENLFSLNLFCRHFSGILN
jgi:hypothetical protein